MSVLISCQDLGESVPLLDPLAIVSSRGSHQSLDRQLGIYDDKRDRDADAWMDGTMSLMRIL